MDRLRRHNLRLGWSLSVDWFNPHRNKLAGKKKLVGSITMALLNLPPSLWYRVENLYIMGIIPGPKEPFLNEINHFLHPLVDFFLPTWKNDTWFTKTMEHSEDQLSQLVIVVAVNNLPVAQKVMGFAGPTIHYLCYLRWLKNLEISNFAFKTWRLHTHGENLDAVTCWWKAESKKGWDKIFKKTEVQWLELLWLPYWDSPMEKNNTDTLEKTN